VIWGDRKYNPVVVVIIFPLFVVIESLWIFLYLMLVFVVRHAVFEAFLIVILDIYSSFLSRYPIWQFDVIGTRYRFVFPQLQVHVDNPNQVPVSFVVVPAFYFVINLC